MTIEMDKDQLEITLGDCQIPTYMWDGIVSYILYGLPPGQFLKAIIKNDLKGAFTYADQTNAKLIYNYVNFFFNFAPTGCWGSQENMDSWIEKKRNELQGGDK